MQNVFVNVNGEILAADQAKVSVFDRSYLYGDSLYEVARTYHGRIFALDEHLARLQKSAQLARMVLSQDLNEYKREMHRTYEAFKTASPENASKEAYIRIVVSRGVGKIGFGLNCLLTPTQYCIIVQELQTPTPEQFEKGAKVQISTRLRNDPRALTPALKSGNYLNNLLAFLEAAQDGYDDSLMVNVDGHLTEGTVFNIFYVRRGVVATPPLDIGILDGITRRQVIEICRDFDIPVREVRFPRERLFEAEEVFWTSTTKEVFPITRVDQHVIGDGKPGPITRKLLAEFRKRYATPAEGRNSK